MMIQPCPKVQATNIDLDLSDTHNSLPQSLLGTADTHITIDPSMPGKQHGHLVLPYANAESGTKQLRIPVCSITGTQPGPTVTMMAGVHGDEYEGSLALQRMARGLAADSVYGCLILVPAVNTLGLRRARRCSPLDGMDMDRCFPGTAMGSISERVAHEIFERLIRPSDLVVDLRSGGGALEFAPLAAVRFMGVLNRPAELQARAEEAMIAFGAPNSVRFPASVFGSCLQAAVDAAGKAYVQTELGGGGGCRAETLDIAQVGCHNVLRQVGLLKSEVQLRHSRMLEVRDSSFYVYATTDGLFEPHVHLGHELWQGDTLASLISIDNTGSEPHLVAVPRNGVLLGLHHGGPVAAGDLIAVLADEVQR